LEYLRIGFIIEVDFTWKEF